MNQEKPDSNKGSTTEIHKNLLEHVPAVIYAAEIGELGKWFYVSPRIEELLGYKPAEWLADPRLWMQQVHPEDRKHVLDQKAESVQSGYFSSEYRMFTRDGKELWVRDEGNIGKEDSLCYGFLFDITSEKQAAQKVKEFEKQMEVERVQLEQRLRALHKFEAIGRLAAGVAHDFNNLLMAITSYCELLKMKLSDSPSPELHEIQRAAAEGSVLTRHLLAFGGKQIQAPRRLDINQVLKNLQPMIRRLLKENVEVQMVLAEDLGGVQADLSQMEDMLINLVVVAREAMPKGGRILLETCNIDLDFSVTVAHASMHPGKYVQLAVTDTGAGLDEDAIAHIFEPFYTSKDHTTGGGLRLPAVYGIVKQNAGNIWVYSEPGRGTTFKIYLPRIDSEIETPVQTKQPAPHFSAAGQTILVVDDNDAVRVAISAYLEMNNFRVLQASNGKDAMGVASSKEEQKIDMLITDLVMPQMGGLELSQQLSMRNPSLKVLYMSGYTEESVIRQGALEPGAFFLQKPASMKILLKKVRELLST